MKTRMGIALVLVGLNALAAHAAPVTYEYLSGAAVFPPNLPADTRYGARITFADALAPNSTVNLNPTVFGYGRPGSDGVLAFSTGTSPQAPTLASYGTAGDPGSIESVTFYSVLSGSLSTDTLGNINIWDVDFLLFFQNPLTMWTGDPLLSPGPTSTFNPIRATEQFYINSSPATTSFFGNGQQDTYFDEQTTVLNGNRFARYTGTIGSWTRVGAPDPVLPLPGVAWLFAVGVIALGRYQARV
jgi:hypothetical protein